MFKGGMPGNMNNILMQAQKLQKQMEQTKAEVESKIFEATVGGGAVTAKVNGKKELVDINIKEEVVDPDDIEMLEDLIVAATNEALRKMEEESASAMNSIAGGLGNLGGFPF